MGVIPDGDGAVARHWLLPQEAAYRRWAAHMIARRTGPNPQRAAFEKMYVPDGVVYFEAGLGDMSGAAAALIGGVVVLATGIAVPGGYLALCGLGAFRADRSGAIPAGPQSREGVPRR
jgi:hypothetical protein